MVDLGQHEVLAQKQLPIPDPYLMADSSTGVPGTSSTKLAGSRTERKNLVLQILGTCALIAGPAQRATDKDAGSILVVLTPLLQAPLPPAEVTSRGFKGPTPIPSSFFSLPFLLLEDIH